MRGVVLLFVLLTLRLDAQTIRYPLQRFTETHAIVFTGDGVAWASTSRGVVRLEPNGTLTTVVPENLVFTIVVGPDGAVWTSNRTQLIRIDPVTLATQRFDFPHRIASVVAGSDGMLWVITSGPSTVTRFTTTGQIVSSHPSTLPSDFHEVQVVEAGGALWFLGAGLTRVDAAGVRQSFAVSPYAVWLALAGDFLWVVEDWFAPSVRLRAFRVSLTGAVLATYDLPQGVVAYGIAADAAGNLLISDESTGDIVRMTPQGVATRIARLPRIETSCDVIPYEAMAVSPDGRIAIERQYGFLGGTIAPPSHPCRTDTAAQPSITIIDLAHLNEIPTLAGWAVAVLALVTAVAGTLLAAGRP
jgi:streptogramin lyase